MPRAPAGIDRVLRTCKDAILQLLAPYGDGLGRRLGCGSYGCIWQILANVRGKVAPTRYVLKVSADRTEGPVIQAIINSGLDKHLDGLARWEGVWRVPARVARHDAMWIIVREDVDPVGDVLDVLDALDAASPRDAQVRRLANEVSELDYALTLYDAGRYPPAWRRPRGRQKVTAKQRRRPGMIELSDNVLGRPIAEAIEALKSSAGVVLHDVHFGNLGIRTHSWAATGGQRVLGQIGEVRGRAIRPLLIFDHGESIVTRETVVAPFESVVRANPALAKLANEIPAL